MIRVTPFDARAYYYYYGADARATRRTGIIGGFSPLSLSPLVWLDPSDLSTLFQDSAMTTPVTANNDPVGAILDKSGNGNHLIQATAGARPLYKTSGGLHWLECDGTDDQLALDFSADAQPYETLAALQIITSTGSETMVGGGVTNNGGAIFIDATNINVFAGTVLTGPAQPSNGTDFVATARFNGLSSRIAVDNGSYTTGQGGALSLTGLSVGMGPASGFANMRFYGSITTPALLTDGQISQARTYLAAKQGRSL